MTIGERNELISKDPDLFVMQHCFSEFAPSGSIRDGKDTTQFVIVKQYVRILTSRSQGEGQSYKIIMAGVM